MASAKDLIILHSARILGCPKNPNFCDPTRPELSSFFGFSDPKKPDLKSLTRPDPTRTSDFGFFRVPDPKTPNFI